MSGKKKKVKASTKSDSDDSDWETKKKKKKTDSLVEQNCIVHMDDSNRQSFTILNKEEEWERIKKLKEIAQLRLQQDNSNYRMEKVSEKILSHTIGAAGAGYHRDCYANFTSNLSRLKQPDDLPNSASASAPRNSRRSGVGETILFNPDCIFCNRIGKISIKKSGYKTTEDTTVFNKEGGPSVFKHAEEIDDEKLLTRISGFDLFSCEARYHPSCRKTYMCKKNIIYSQAKRSKNEENRAKQTETERVHQEAFQKVSEVIEREVVKKQTIMKFYLLLDLYKEHLKGTEFENPNYRPEKLRKKIEKDAYLSSKIGFCLVDKGKRIFLSCLVYSLEMEMTNAVRQSFDLGLSFTNKVSETANEIRQEILNVFKLRDSSHWPPRVEDQLNYADLVPTTLQKFLSTIISGLENPKSERVSRLMFSISQDICKAATNGQWDLPKHILLGMTLRHLFRSAELTTILNRLGHVSNYHFLLELETALANQADQSSHLLTNNVVRKPTCQSVFHSDFDNFDQYTNEVTGAGSVHRAHGIMLQELLAEDEKCIGGSKPEVMYQEKSNKRSYKFQSQNSLGDNFYMGIRNNPTLKIVEREVPGGDQEHRAMLLEGSIWVFLRATIAETGLQCYPAWSGFVSLLGTPPIRPTTIDYYPVIPFPITDYATIAETLRFAEEASKEVGQKYAIVTYDLGVCLKAYPLIWNYSERYKNHIVMIGTFHIICAYMKMVAKKMKGSGFSDILMESDLMTSGSMVSVLSGKGYAHAMNCHKTLMEALERLLWKQFSKTNENEDVISMMNAAKAQILIHRTQPDSDLKKLILLDNITTVVKEYRKFRDEVKSGILGPTARFWVSYADHVWLMLSLLHAVKCNNYLEYAFCISLLPDLFFAFGGQNYARYLTYFSMYLANIDHSHPGALDLIKTGVFSVARSFVLMAENEGKKQKEAFIKDRLGDENKDKKAKNGDGIFFSKITKLKLKTMDSANPSVTLTKSDKTHVQYRQDGSFVFNLLVQLEKMGTDKIDLKDFMSYPLTPVPYCIGTLDGFLAKTNKAKCFQWLTNKVGSSKSPNNDDTLVIEDGNAYFHCLSDIPDNFGMIAEKIFHMISSYNSVVFSTDMYRTDSVKSMERVRRGTSTKLLIGGPKTKKPPDWKQFLKNDENKKRLIEIIQEVWSSESFVSKIGNKKITFICEDKATELKMQNHKINKKIVTEINSNQEETDSRVILYCFYAKYEGYKNVVVRSPDSDIFFILLSYIHELDGLMVFFETGTKNKKRLINMSSFKTVYSEEYCKALLSLHAFTGCDSTSAFKGKGKVRALKHLLKDKDMLQAFAALGNQWSVPDDISQLEKLTCKLYGTPHANTVNECRYIKLISACCPDNLNIVNPTKKIDTAFIPPAYESFVQHVKRVNYQVGIWKQSHLQFPVIPSPTMDNGWYTDENGILRPIWFTGDMLPQTVVNELSTDSTDGDDQEEDVDVDEVIFEIEDDFDYSQFINELFEDSADKEEFEGFDLDDLENN